MQAFCFDIYGFCLSIKFIQTTCFYSYTQKAQSNQNKQKTFSIAYNESIWKIRYKVAEKINIKLFNEIHKCWCKKPKLFQFSQEKEALQTQIGTDFIVIGSFCKKRFVCEGIWNFQFAIFDEVLKCRYSAKHQSRSYIFVITVLPEFKCLFDIKIYSFLYFQLKT